MTILSAVRQSIIGLALAGMALGVAVQPVAAGVACCQCDCPGTDICTEGPANGENCELFCLEFDCSFAAFSPVMCSTIPACDARRVSGPVRAPALGELGLIAMTLALAAFGLRTLRPQPARARRSLRRRITPASRRRRSAPRR